MSHLPITLLATVLLLGLPAAAQTGNPAAMQPGSPESEPGSPAPHVPNTQDRLFVMLVGSGGMAEVKLGRMAQGKGSSASVKSFARRMVDEHEAANQQLKELAEAAGIPMPAEPDPEHKAMHDTLEKLSGAEFDRAYIDGQVVDHQKTVQLLTWELGSGQDPALKQLAADALPKIYAHLSLAQIVQAELTGHAPSRLTVATTPVPAAKPAPR